MQGANKPIEYRYEISLWLALLEGNGRGRVPCGPTYSQMDPFKSPTDLQERG